MFVEFMFQQNYGSLWNLERHAPIGHPVYALKDLWWGGATTLAALLVQDFYNVSINMT